MPTAPLPARSAGELGLSAEAARPFVGNVDKFGVAAGVDVASVDVDLSAVSGDVSEADAEMSRGVVCSDDCDPIAYTQPEAARHEHFMPADAVDRRYVLILEDFVEGAIGGDFVDAPVTVAG